MSIKEVDRIKGNSNAIEAYRVGMNSLFQAGIIDALRVLGRPYRRKNGTDQAEMASEASWSAGWNDCLETLLYFQERYLEIDNLETPRIKMNFGALEAAVASGDLTTEEADAIRSGKPIVYDTKQYTSNIPSPAPSKDRV